MQRSVRHHLDDFRWRLRVTAEGASPSTVFVRRHQFDVGAPLQFDEDYGHITALEYALGALAGDLVGCLQSMSRKRRIRLDNIEATVSAQLDNALTYLGVVGETGHPGLKRIAITVYVRSEAPEEEIRPLWAEALERSPLVRTLSGAVELDLAMRVVV